MDFLASLQIDSLPEQQTRASHLAEALVDDPDLRLGFNACCTCGSREPRRPGKSSSRGAKWVECTGCHRVNYCSEECRKKDANPHGRSHVTTTTASVPTSDEHHAAAEEEDALGHSPVICSLLRLCNEDEDAEDPETAGKAPEEAHDRVRSELESYPATISNILMEGPCYKHLFRGPLDKENDPLILHVIGASEEAELWGSHDGDYENVWSAYGEALSQLAEGTSLRGISIFLIGPECPPTDQCFDKTINLREERGGKKSGRCFKLHIESHRAKYDAKIVRKIPNADVVVFFNPGFTCPDYNWDGAMSCLKLGTAFLIATNTQMEGVNDCHYLLDQGLLPSLPPLVAEVVGVGSDYQCDNDPAIQAFFAENPYAGNRVRQNGTMANDLFVRNRWMYGGVFASKATIKSRKTRTGDWDEPESSKKTKRTKKEGSRGKRSNNAALI